MQNLLYPRAGAKPFIDLEKVPAPLRLELKNFRPVLSSTAKKYLPRHICNLGYHNSKLSVLN